ncbi:hypothetical protein CRG98_030750 [Punica granatum]|uniref:Uncharacterized protein n=1 Tax=Punica granatum TaxID=22663 RepID=A0A2I0IY22_PUNGR|nr:hypothetical protein CRG98_030750 [Punica granatum]
MVKDPGRPIIMKARVEVADWWPQPPNRRGASSRSFRLIHGLGPPIDDPNASTEVARIITRGPEVPLRQSTTPIKEESSRHLTIKKSRKAAVLVWNGMPPIDLWLGPCRDLPQDVNNNIEGFEGTDILLVCEKYLTANDVKKEESRLLMPESVIKSSSFLNDQERGSLVFVDD